MPPTREKTAQYPSSGTARTGRCFSPRDRVLFYLDSLALDQVTSLELAAECLRLAGESCDAATAMESLQTILREKRLGLPDPASITRQRSFPPHNRTTMVSKKLMPFSLLGWCKNIFSPAPRVDDLDENVPARQEGA